MWCFASSQVMLTVSRARPPRLRWPSEREPDEPKHLQLAPIHVTIRRGDALARFYNEPSRRAAREAPQGFDRHLHAFILLELAKARVESIEYVEAREDRQKPIALKHIEHLVTLNGLDSAIGSGNQSGRRDGGIQQLVFAVIHIRRGDVGRSHARTIAGVAVSHANSSFCCTVARRRNRISLSGEGSTGSPGPDVDRSERTPAQEHG
jgi:hypothetical protein